MAKDLLKNRKTVKISELRSNITGENALESNKFPRHINLDVKPEVSDIKTREIIEDIYSGQSKKSKVGNGTMMDAIRNELKTGKPTERKFHSVKAKNTIIALHGRLSSGKLHKVDKTIVRAIIKDLKAAISGH